MRGCDLAESAAQLEGDVPGIEIGELGLLRGTSALGLDAERLNLVIIGRVLLTVQSGRWFGAELVAALQCETRDGTQPWHQHRSAGGRRRRLVRGGRAPNARGIVTGKGGRRRIGQTPVISPQVKDTGSGLLADHYARTVLRQAFLGQIIAVGRVEGRGLRWKD